MMEQFLLLFPLLLAAYLTLSILKLPDLSLESAFVFGATLSTLGASPPLALILSIVGGLVVGLTCASLYRIFHLPFLLSAILTNGLFHGLTLFVLGGAMKSVSGRIDLYTFLGLTEMTTLLLFATILLTLFYFLSRTQLGMTFAIYGNNPTFFKHHRINASYVVTLALCLADLFAALSGYLFTQSNGFAEVHMGIGIVLQAITALVIGRLICGGTSLLRPLLGGVSFFLIQSALLHIGLDLRYFNTFQSLVVIAALVALNRQKPLEHLGV